jgi:hypothetical protein
LALIREAEATPTTEPAMDARPYELPPGPILQALGILLLSFSELEESLHFVIADEFTQHSDAARTLTSGMSFEALAEKFRALYQERFPPPDGPGDIRAFAAHLSDLHSRRDALVHLIWLQWDTGVTQRASRRPSTAHGFRIEARIVSASEILAFAAELDLTSRRLLEYRAALRAPGALVGTV